MRELIAFQGDADHVAWKAGADTAISTAFLGVLFAIRRILARAPAEASSDCIASDARDSRGIAGVIAPPPLVFLGFLALAAILEAVIPPSTVLFPHVRDVAGAVLFIIGLIIVDVGVQGLRASGTNISTDLPATALVVDGIYRWSRNPLFLSGDDALVCRACDCGWKRLGHHAPHPITGRDEHRRHFQGRAVPRARVW